MKKRKQEDKKKEEVQSVRIQSDPDKTRVSPAFSRASASRPCEAEDWQRTSYVEFCRITGCVTRVLYVDGTHFRRRPPLPLFVALLEQVELQSNPGRILQGHFVQLINRERLKRLTLVELIA
jgi:hypothetical protein